MGLLILAAVWAIFGFVGAYIAQEKGRGQSEGALLGVLLGPIGLVIAVLMPTGTGAGSKSPQRPDTATQAKPSHERSIRTP